jgi:hypothetical protein
VTLTTKLAHTVADTLFGSIEPGDSLFLLLDAARNPGLPLRLKAANAQHECLYQGPTAAELWFVAPYLLRCERGSPLLTWLLANGWGESWGVFASAAVDLASLRQHFRKLLLVKLDGEDANFYFRFYDPRVLRIFLPTCTPEQVVEFFGPIHSFVTEDRGPAGGVKFRLSPIGLVQELLPCSPSVAPQQ